MLVRWLRRRSGLDHKSPQVRRQAITELSEDAQTGAQGALLRLGVSDYVSALALLHENGEEFKDINILSFNR